jgi:hypothetical protein
MPAILMESNNSCAMSKVQRRLERYADELIGDAKLFGMEIDDPIINTKRRMITASRVFERQGEGYMIVKFNRQGSQIEEVGLAVDYYHVEATFTQQMTFHNYKKFEESTTGSPRKRYKAIFDLMAKERPQQAVDMFERMPGVSDVNWFISNYETGEFTTFM